MISGKVIFISPLDWGLGHASRCVPLIRLLNEKNKVILGVTELNSFFFGQEFPNLKKITLPSYAIRYSASIPVWLKVLLQWPRISRVILQEKEQLRELIAQHGINLVISDSRFGLIHPSVHCILMSHQLKLKAPFFSFIPNRLNKKLIERFSEVWVPDYESIHERLSGELSDTSGITIPVKFIGPQSYLEKEVKEPAASEKIDCLILLSGVEPQRSLLEDLLIRQLGHSGKRTVLVRGSHSANRLRADNIKIISFASGNELSQLIVNSETVICRSGYSSLMDLHLLGKKKLVLIPTPGQTEQEYLASYWKEKFGARVILQKQLGTKIHLLPEQ